MFNFDFLEKGLGKVPPTYFCGAVVYWLSLLHNFIQQSLNWGSGSQTCTRHVGYLRLLGSLTMVPGGKKAKCLLSVNHTTKTIHHHHHHFSTKMLLIFFFYYFSKFHCLIFFTSWVIGQYVYRNFLFSKLWHHKFWNWFCLFNQAVFLSNQNVKTKI